MVTLLHLNDDALHHIISFCSSTTLATLASTCRHLQCLLNKVSRVWRNLTVFAFTHFLFLTPHIAIKAHGPHILRITLGQKNSASVHWTHVTTHTVNTIARYCTNLQELFMYTHEATIMCDVIDMVDVLTHCLHLRNVCIPYKLTHLHVDDVLHVKQQIQLHALTLFGSCQSVPIAFGTVSLFRVMDVRCLRVLKLSHVVGLNLTQVLRHFHHLSTLVIRKCVSNGALGATWEYPVNTLQTLKVHQSKSVVRSMNPVVMSLQYSTSALPLTHLAGDSDDVAFVRFAFTLTCGRCSKVNNRNFHLITDMCETCCQKAPSHLKQLRRIKFYNTYSTRF